MSNWRQAFVTGYEPEVNDAKVVVSEKHNATECKYERRAAIRNGKKVYYWIRTCGCGKETDHSDMLNIQPDKLEKVDGIELHLKEDCQWVLPKLNVILGYTKRNASRNWKRKCVCRQYRSSH